MLADADIQVYHIRLESAISLEYDMFSTTLRLPICKAVGEDAASASGSAEGRGKLVAVAEVEEVGAGLINKTTTRLVLLIATIVERVNIAQ